MLIQLQTVEVGRDHVCLDVKHGDTYLGGLIIGQQDGISKFYDLEEAKETV
jgi:hypothetical protein